MAFPSSTDSFAGFTSTHTLQADNHAAQHNLEQAAIVAVETKVGTGASTPTNNTVLRGSGTGTTAFDTVHLATDVSGILGTANGGTGSASITGSGLPVFQTSPTITSPTESGGTYNTATLSSPTIGSFTNSQHNHQNAAGGGTLAAAAITSLDLTNTTLLNPYKFFVYRNAAWTTSSSFTLVQHDAKVFDTGSNVDVVTNKGRFTVPVSGFYFLLANVNETTGSATDMAITFYKNGSPFIQGTTSHPSSANNALNVSAITQLAANDYIEVFYIGGNGSGGAAGNSPYYTWFQGFLVSTT